MLHLRDSEGVVGRCHDPKPFPAVIDVGLMFQQETSCKEHAEGWLTGWIWNFEVCCHIGKVAVRQSLNISFHGATDSENLDYTVDMETDRLIYTGIVQCSNEGTVGKTRRSTGCYLASVV